MNEALEKRLLELTGRLCDEQITGEEFAELDSLLGSGREAREAYRVYLEMHHCLAGGALEGGVTPSQKVVTFPFKKVAIVLAGVALVMLGVFLNRSFSPDPIPEVAVEPDPLPDFVMTRAIDVEWEHPTRFQAVLGEPIENGHLRLESGIAEIRFSSGAIVTVEGPAKLRLDNPMKCFSHYGKLAAFCPESAHGFMIRFNGGKVTDLGTEFALNSEEGGRTDVHVLDGEVIVARTDGEDRVVREQNLKGNSAVSVGEGIEEIAYDDESFTRLTRESLNRTQPIKLQFDLGHRAGLYKGTNAPAHAAGDMFSHEDTWTQIVGDQSGAFVMADGRVCPHPITVDYGHGDGEINWEATPVDPWGKVYTDAGGVFDSALCQDHRPWDFDLGLRVSGLPVGNYRIYALCRSVRRPGASYDVSMGVNLDAQQAVPMVMPPMEQSDNPSWEAGITYAAGDVKITGPDDWATFITRYSRERSVRSTDHHGRSVLLGLQIVEIR